MVFLFILFAFVAFALSVLFVRRAVPLVTAGVAAWAAWTFAHDPLATGLAGLAALLVASWAMDNAAMSESRPLRLIARGVEFTAGIAVAVFLAWSVARGFREEELTPEQLAVICISGGVIGVALVAARYRSAY